MVRLTFFRLFSIGILVVGSAFGSFAVAKKSGSDPLEKAFGEHCKKVYADLFKLTEEMRKDLWKSTDFFYWGRLNAQLQTLPNAQLVEIFKPFKSKEEFMTFHDYVQSGAAGSSAAERDMVSELMHMVDDLTAGGADPF